MSQNQEIIESKLCAYIDGELDPEGRAEIEKHLEANPQHRRLLESLKATRDLLKWLPREPAPAEIAETLNGQLERSVLLDYTGDSLRISPWPRIFAAAAIIVLTAGLGAAVYFALPRQKPAQLVAHNFPTPTDTESVKSGSPDLPTPAPIVGEAPVAGVDRKTDPYDLKRTGDQRDELASADHTAKKDGTANGSQPRPEPLGDNRQIAMAPNADTANKTVGSYAVNNSSQELEQLATQVAQNPTYFKFPAEAAGNYARNATAGAASGNALSNDGNTTLSNGNATSANNGALVMVVRSDSPEQTEKQLTSYFASQQIQWRTTQLPAEPDAGAQPTQSQNQLREQIVRNDGQDAAAMGEKGGALNVAPSAPPAPARASKAGSNLRGAGEAGNLQDNAAANQIPATGPSLPGAYAGKGAVAAKPGADDSESAKNTYAFQPQQQPMQTAGNSVTQNALNQNGYASNGVYVCQMSRRQAEQLTSAISRDGSAAPEVKDVPNLTQNAFNELQKRALNDSPNSSSQSPSIGGLSGRDRDVRRNFENSSVQEQAKQKAMTERRSIDKAATTEPAAPAAIGPSQPYFGGASHAAQGAADVQQGVAAPMTQPATAFNAATTAPAPDEPVNVVILVQNTAAPNAAAGPATQPAPASAPPPSTQPSQLTR